MKENLYKGLQFTFFPFYRKDVIRVWHCNLRNPVKATSLGHPRYTEARPQYKAFNISPQCFHRQPAETTWVPRPKDWKGQDTSRKTTTNWVRSLLVSVLTANDFTNETRHPRLMIFLPPWSESGKVNWSG
jgi:hypothetical protein